MEEEPGEPPALLCTPNGLAKQWEKGIGRSWKTGTVPCINLPNFVKNKTNGNFFRNIKRFREKINLFVYILKNDLYFCGKDGNVCCFTKIPCIGSFAALYYTIRRNTKNTKPERKWRLPKGGAI